MSKRETILRYHTIISKLQRFPATTQQILDKLSKESEIQSYNLNISKRTLLRDLEDIRVIYNIDIIYDKFKGSYFIDFEGQTEMQERVIEALNTFNALNFSDKLSNHIHFEKRKPKGTENLHGFLHAIKNKFQIRFTHQKYWDDESTNRIVEPYSLKEFKNRWYILAKDLKDNKVKSFALDRLTKLEITTTSFQFPKDFDVNEHYKYCFGIISPNEQKPQEIILSFDTLKGKYIKSLPLHESQQIISDDNNEFRISLNIVITFDFLMEILSHGSSVKVIKPDSLINELKKVYADALGLYS
jgi:predicted DNA-binding transcriptional regulator YafY